MVNTKSYVELQAEHVDVLDKLIKCKKCKHYMFSIYDKKVRDTCSDCGGKSKVVKDD